MHMAFEFCCKYNVTREGMVSGIKNNSYWSTKVFAKMQSRIPVLTIC